MSESQFNPHEATSGSLLRRVQARDSDAWHVFSELYGPIVYGWARRCGLNAHDAADAAQEVFLSVHRKVADFRSDLAGSTMRGWLWTITRNVVRQQFRQRLRHPPAVGGSVPQRQLAELPDLLDSTDEPDEPETDRWLVHRALGFLRAEFEARTWEAFSKCVLDGKSPSNVAAELNLSPGAVRQAKYRVLQRLRVFLVAK